MDAEEAASFANAPATSVEEAEKPVGNAEALVEEVEEPVGKAEEPVEQTEELNSCGNPAGSLQGVEWRGVHGCRCFCPPAHARRLRHCLE